MSAVISSPERQTFDGLLADVKSSVDAALDALFASLHERSIQYGPAVEKTLLALSHLTRRGGKRFRPTLLAAAYLAAGGASPEDVTPAGAALELLQSYFLIHDDWMDRDDMRRGGPSVHAELREYLGSEHDGAVSAILAGDLAVSLAQRALALQIASPERLLQATRAFAETQVDVVFGQLLDVHEATRSRSDVERMHYLKTTSYTVAGPVSMGAALAGASPALQATLRRYSEPLGLAFQIRDDLLGTFGDPRVTGKPVGNDIREGKRTALALELLDDAQGRILLSPFLHPASSRRAAALDADSRAHSDSDVASVMEYMISSGARARVEQRLTQLLQEALGALRGAPLATRGRAALEGAVAALGTRNS